MNAVFASSEAWAGAGQQETASHKTILPETKEYRRRDNTTSYFFPSEGHPMYKDVASYTDIYARQNRKHFKGDRETAEPAGFWIVAWKNGTLEKVPVEKIRECGDRPCFPSIAGYENSKPWPFYVKR